MLMRWGISNLAKSCSVGIDVQSSSDEAKIGLSYRLRNRKSFFASSAVSDSCCRDCLHSAAFTTCGLLLALTLKSYHNAYECLQWEPQKAFFPYAHSNYNLRGTLKALSCSFQVISSTILHSLHYIINYTLASFDTIAQILFIGSNSLAVSSPCHLIRLFSTLLTLVSFLGSLLSSSYPIWCWTWCITFCVTLRRQWKKRRKVQLC